MKTTKKYEVNCCKMFRNGYRISKNLVDKNVQPGAVWSKTYRAYKTAERMMLNVAESGHPTFRATSALERGDLRSKGKVYHLQENDYRNA